MSSMNGESKIGLKTVGSRSIELGRSQEEENSW
jgi:hypothetical protein